MAPWAPPSVAFPSSNEHRSNLVGKRKAEDEFESQSNISNQFKKLRLKPARAHAHPPPQPCRPHIANTDARPALPLPSTYYDHEIPPSHTPPTLTDSEFMTVDDEPHRIIINDLDAEIAQIEAAEAADASAVFLPDIDKKVSAIPQHLLRSRKAAATSEGLSTALVLYREPSSISVPEEEDAVRKAIIAARARARERQAEDPRDREGQESPQQKDGESQSDIELDDAMTDPSSRGDEDLDAMEIE